MYTRRPRLLIAILMMSFFTMFGVLGIASHALANYGDSILSLGSRGSYVSNLQKDLCSLGYNTFGIDGIFGRNTCNAVIDFQKDNALSVDGKVGPQTKKALKESINKSKVTYTVKAGDTLYKIAKKYGITVQSLMQTNNKSSYMIYPGEQLVVSMNSFNSSNPSKAEPADWWTVVTYAFPRGAVATVTDVETGISYQVIRSGGTNHADVQPLTWNDTQKMKKIYGGSWSWNRRAVVVTVNGKRFAASQNGMPHGNQTIYNNGFDGHFCIHFKNSRTHGTNRVDAAHQAAVMKAAGY